MEFNKEVTTKITFVSTYEPKKFTFVSKAGKPYEQFNVSFKTEYSGEEWVSCFVFDNQMPKYRVLGSEVTGEFVKKEKNGKTFLNFYPKRELSEKQKMAQELEELKAKLAEKESGTPVEPTVDEAVNESVDDIKPEDIPFA